MNAVYLRNVLKKYMNFIRDMEGTTFLDYYPHYASDIEFTQDNMKTLLEIEEELK